MYKSEVLSSPKEFHSSSLKQKPEDHPTEASSGSISILPCWDKLPPSNTVCLWFFRQLSSNIFKTIKNIFSVMLFSCFTNILQLALSLYPPTLKCVSLSNVHLCHCCTMCCKNVMKTIALFKKLSVQLIIKEIHFSIIYWDKFIQISINGYPKSQKASCHWCIAVKSVQVDAMIPKNYLYSLEVSTFICITYQKCTNLAAIYSSASILHSGLFLKYFCDSLFPAGKPFILIRIPWKLLNKADFSGRRNAVIVLLLFVRNMNNIIII